MPTPSFASPPPPQTYALVSFPQQYVMLVTFNRPKSLNCINIPSHWELHHLFQWFDDEPLLRVAVVTGMGRAFCAGADLKEWNTSNQSGATRNGTMPSSGFGAISRRTGRKPIIAAVNGLAYGGGMELVTNIDMIVAAHSATFSLPEVKRGVFAGAGALPRIVRTIGKQRAMEMALTGRTVSASEAMGWGLVNAVTDDAAIDAPVESRPVVRKALEYAAMITDNSPDSVIVSREGVKLGWEGLGAEEATRLVDETWGRRLREGQNIKEGVLAFSEKRKPKWVPSKL